jgi:hypothetical protein
MRSHFVGSKGGSGIPQWLITMMPAHRVFLEMFLGRGTIMDEKRPAEFSIGIDADAAAIDDYRRRHAQTNPAAAIVHGDCLKLVPGLKVESDWLVYADPPYLLSTRSHKRAYYDHEMFSEEEHDRLLTLLLSLPSMIMISGYWSELYAERLKGWRVAYFDTVNRAGKPAREFVWMNFEPPAVLHDTRHVGTDFTDRQRVKRKAERWRKKFQHLPAAERQLILNTLLSMPPAA